MILAYKSSSFCGKLPVSISLLTVVLSNFGVIPAMALTTSGSMPSGSIASPVLSLLPASAISSSVQRGTSMTISGQYY